MAGNLRDSLPEKEKIISTKDEIITSNDSGEATIDEFGRVQFNRSNFPDLNLESTNLRVQSLSSFIDTTVNDKLSSFETPEILALQYKHSSNAEGDVIGIGGHSITDLKFEEHVNTIKPVDLTNNLPVSKNAATKSEIVRSTGAADIILSPGVFRVECTGTFTLVGLPGGPDGNGGIFGNDSRAYVMLELYKETQPSEILLYSTPSVEYATATNIDDSTASVTCYMYGYISICNPSVLKLRAKTAGSYALGTVDPDAAGNFPDTFINPVQIVFEKVCDDPFCMEVASSEVDIFTGFTPYTTTTIPAEGDIPDVTPIPTTPAPPGTGTTSPSGTPDGSPGGGGGGGGGSGAPFNRAKVACDNANLCVSSPRFRGLPLWPYSVAPDLGSRVRPADEQPGWSWFSLVNKDPNNIDTLILEAADARHNQPGGLMGLKNADGGDAKIWKNRGVTTEWSVEESRERGMCNICRGPLPTSPTRSPIPTPPSTDAMFRSANNETYNEWCMVVRPPTVAGEIVTFNDDGTTEQFNVVDFVVEDEEDFFTLDDFYGTSGFYTYPDPDYNYPDPVNPPTTTTPAPLADPDRCLVDLAYPCFVRDWGMEAIEEGDMTSGTYNSEPILNELDGESIDPNDIKNLIDEIIFDGNYDVLRNDINKDPNTDQKMDVNHRAALSQIKWSNDEENHCRSVDQIKTVFIEKQTEWFILDGNDEATAIGLAEAQWESRNNEERLEWRAGDTGSTDDDDLKIIFEETILPSLIIVMDNPPTTYDEIIANQDLLRIFGLGLRNLNNIISSYTTLTPDTLPQDYRDFWNALDFSVDNRDKIADLLEHIISHAPYYSAQKAITPAGDGIAAIREFRDAPPANDVYFRSWWKSTVISNLVNALENEDHGELMVGPGSTKFDPGTGNCCMTKIAMIIEAYWWNHDQFQPGKTDPRSESASYQFISWWKDFDEDERGGIYDKFDIEDINAYPWLKRPVDLLGIMKHPHPHAITAEATIVDGQFTTGCLD